MIATAADLLCGIYPASESSSGDGVTTQLQAPALVTRATMVTSPSSATRVNNSPCTPTADIQCDLTGVFGAGMAAVRLSHNGGVSWSSTASIVGFWAAASLEPLSGPAAGAYVLPNGSPVCLTSPVRSYLLPGVLPSVLLD